jgi:hydroxyacylglutathione hydrolase
MSQSTFSPEVNTESLGFSVTPIPCLSDNYAYLIVDPASSAAAVVDPVEPEKVAAACAAANVPLASVAALLTTHKHSDHAGGNVVMVHLVEAAASAAGSPCALEVYGGALDAVPSATRALSHGDTFTVGTLSVTALHTPCHTRGHICYWVRPTAAAGAGTDVADPSASAGAVFSGDTLFVGGCGRLFEGSASEMYANLTGAARLGRLPDETLVYTGHEYTRSNLLFCAEAVSEDLDASVAAAAGDGADAGDSRAAAAAIASKLEWLSRGAHDGKGCTQPSTMGQERLTNVFVRAGSEDELARLRAWKDDWRPRQK